MFFAGGGTSWIEVTLGFRSLIIYQCENLSTVMLVSLLVSFESCK